eukprot:9101-Heterococcus_DN1.PRE.2
MLANELCDGRNACVHALTRQQCAGCIRVCDLVPVLDVQLLRLLQPACPSLSLSQIAGAHRHLVLALLACCMPGLQGPPHHSLCAASLQRGPSDDMPPATQVSTSRCKNFDCESRQRYQSIYRDTMISLSYRQRLTINTIYMVRLISFAEHDIAISAVIIAVFHCSHGAMSHTAAVAAVEQCEWL